MINPINLKNHRSVTGATDANWPVYQPLVTAIHDKLHEHNVPGTGWLQDPLEQNSSVLFELNWLVEEIQAQADTLIVIGVGGSYNGTKAVQQALTPYFKESDIEIIYAGHNLSGAYMEQLLQHLQHKNPYVYVVSKSGTTLETCLTFRLLTQFMKTKFGQNYSDRILVATDETSSPLREIAKLNHYRCFPIPTTIGGRYSLFTVVSLLPLAVAGIDIIEVLKGASTAAKQLSKREIHHNIAYQYAILRHEYYKKGYHVELLASFEPCLTTLHEWWKQLFGESEGKQQKGLFPTSANYSTDLHSIGQFIQQGNPILFETILSFGQMEGDVVIPHDQNNIDQLNDLANRSFNEINCHTKEGVIRAHLDAGVPVIELEVHKLDAYHVGYLCYFFMKACAMSACLLGVNPFDQPGVEHYKRKTLESLTNSVVHSMK
ncbi:glucose-6-phosphate isomerase [Solibacillus sp. FSL H8-0523]|uniref:glucose-6-phosphate isomerase n=1 Tax=Solibacillus sp. FSL H8-0523 TaxID=2954511 RepID=UPI0031017899